MKVFLETEPGVDHSSWSEFGINKAKHVGSGTPGLLSGAGLPTIG